MIRSIQIVNVRGIENKTFSFSNPEMHPNKVHLLIASNGFGKSSLAIAFDNLNSRRLTLKEKDYYRHDESKLPSLTLVVQNGTEDISLTADQSKNEIGKYFDIFVIRGPRKVKAMQRPTQSGFQVAVGEFVIDPVELCKIPKKAKIAYEYRKAVVCLGGASKAAPNISNELSNSIIIKAFLDSKWSVKTLGVRLKERYEGFLGKIKVLDGKSDEIIQKIETELWSDVAAITELRDLCAQFTHFNSQAKALLATIQLIDILRENLEMTKQSLHWLDYEIKYTRVKELLKSCNPNPDWINVEVKQTNQTLLISLPKPDTMSNGQRDFLFFVSQLLEFEFRADKGKSILVIDEVFDYLDYANVITCQYFLKKFIDMHVETNTHVYPLILTHLDPSVFNSFIFSKKLQKNHYLDSVKHIIECDSGLPKIIRMRGKDAELEKVFANYHAPHSVSDCDEKEMFESKGLKKNWGCSKTFKTYCRGQIDQYLSDSAGEVDYLAVCLGLRVHIEKCAYDQLGENEQKQFTTETRRTIDKLDFAEVNGAKVPELHYLLAGLYNSALHANTEEWDFLTPVVSKLQNSCIREMIREVFS